MLNVPIQRGNGYCGEDHPELPVIGHADFVRVGSQLTITFVIDNGLANSPYGPQLFDANCSLVATFSGMTTDSNGDASATYNVAVKGKRFFFANATEFAGSGFCDTPYVDLR